MSNWLGFSLTPHLRIHEGFQHGREEDDQNVHGGSSFSHPHPHHQHMSVMPLRSDGSLCVPAQGNIFIYIQPCMLKIIILLVLFS